MGNCVTCLRTQDTQSQLSNQNTDYHKQEMPQVLLCQTATQNIFPPFENHNNGNQKPAVEPCSSLSRFCQRRVTNKTTIAMGNIDSKPSESKLNALFDVYKDAGEDCMLAEGIERFCSDLQVSPDEFKVLVLAFKLNAEQMCRFTRKEFVSGLKSLNADTIKCLQVRLPEIVNELEQNAELFKDLYRFTFRFGLDASVGQRILPIDMAVCLWRLVFTVRAPPVLERWLNFLELHPQFRGIPRDTWNMFLNFAESVGNDLSSYDDTEAWPSLFDDFVEFQNDQMNQNISKAKESDGLLIVKQK